MKDATLAQGNQVLTLILQKKIDLDQLQAVISSGLFSDLLEANVEAVDRERFREVIGLKTTATREVSQEFKDAIAMLEEEATLLEGWVRETRGGGWSTHQVGPMQERILAIRAKVNELKVRAYGL